MAFRILIVDDSPAMRMFIRRTVQISGIDVGEVFEAGGGEQALRLLRDHPADVVLADLNMPGMDGEELLRRLRQDEALHSLPVVVVTTDATVQRARMMLALGASGYVKKPFLPETLRDELERVLEARHG